MDDIEQDYADLIIGRYVLIQKNGNDIPHVVSDPLTVGICTHGEVLN